MERAIITVKGGVAEEVFRSKGVDVLIIDFDNDDIYLYKHNLLCKITAIDDETGTLTLKCVDTTDGSANNRVFDNVSTEDISYFGQDDGEYIDEEDW